MSGCATWKAPAYQPSVANVSTLKTATNSTVAVGAFSVKTDMPGATTLPLRAVTLASSVGTSFADYLAQALKAELELAQRFDPKTTIEITGVLTKNVLNADGMTKGQGEIEAQFVVRRNGEVRFDKLKSGTAEWPSSFMGNIAIPNAAQSYPLLVQNLLTALYADPDFLSAIR